VQSLTVTPTTFRFVVDQFFIVSNDELNTASFLNSTASSVRPHERCDSASHRRDAGQSNLKSVRWPRRAQG
jgi:hypothetical protein